MKVKALRVISGSYGVALEGQEFVVSDGVGKDLIAAGLAVEVGGEQPKEKPAETGSTVKVSGGNKGKLK